MLIKIEITRQDFDFLNFRLFGWLVNTEAPSTSELLGATLEIQRTQTAELMEQRMIRQQQVMIIFFTFCLYSCFLLFGIVLWCKLNQVYIFTSLVQEYKISSRTGKI